MKTFKTYMTESQVSPAEIVHYAVAGNRAHDKAYKWGLMNPTDTPDKFSANQGAAHSKDFGWAASQASAEYGLRSIKGGERNVDKISHEIHKGWASVATTFDDPVYASKPEKKTARLALVNQVRQGGWKSLPEDEKEKDRVLARAYLEKYGK